jgi:DNA repair exonuclease SbcCD ATPase subunit
LDTPIQGSVDYVQQTNDLRVRVLRQYTDLASEFEKLQRVVKSNRAALQAEELSFETLARLASELKTHERQSKELRARRDEFTDTFNEFASWTNLVERGSTLLEEVQRQGELVREQRNDFQHLSQDINGFLSAKKLDALPHAPTYEMRLNEIAEAVRELAAKASNRFGSIQERYQSALVDGLGFPRERLWRPHPYNPVAPDDSYRRVVIEVQSALEAVLEQLSRVITKEQESVRSTLGSPLIATLPADECQALVKQGEELDSEFVTLKEALLSAQQRLTASAIRDFPESDEGQFPALLQELGGIRDRLGESHPSVEELSSVLQALKLTGPEEQLLSSLPTESDVREVSELRQTAKRLSEDDFWTALRGLHAKRRLRVTVEPVRYD